jgi:UTP--glucose-1-phosphate uridylyltransferase
MDIKKAIITAAGPSQHTLPLQTLIDRDGSQKTALAIIIEEVLAAGIESIGVVVRPGDRAAFVDAAGSHASRLEFLEQTSPRGYGHAVYCGRKFVGSQPFLLLVGDHLYVSRQAKNCAQQLIEAARTESCAVSAVQATHESKLPFYGTVGGQLMPGRQRLYAVENVIEKPTPTQAEQELIVPGMRAGHYLCFFGMHVLTPLVMDILEAMMDSGDASKTVHLTTALATLAARERYLAFEVEGRRYDIGIKYGLFIAQLALAMEGKDRQDVLAHLVELLALRG